jgi:predicted ABC-type ATPase
VIAGPNGSGKSTLTATQTQVGEVVDPDAIAKALDPRDPARVAVAAGRRALLRYRALIEARGDFALETTLAGATGIKTMQAAKAAGYRVSLAYICVQDTKLNIERVRLRVALGGHDVPEDDIRRRRLRSLSRVPDAMRIADEAVLLDNSSTAYERVVEMQAGKITWQARRLPGWAQDILASLG